MRNPIKSLAGLWRREDGSSTIEFVFIFPALITVFLMTIELGMLMIRGTMLDRAVDISMRDLRLGSLSPMTHDALRESICNNAIIIPDCMQSILIELSSVPNGTWSAVDSNFKCIDRSDEVQPVVAFDAGAVNELMLVRVCSVFDPFFPTGALAANMKLDTSGAYALMTGSAFVNEP